GRTHLREGRDWLKRMLHISVDAPQSVRARGLYIAAWMEMNAHDYVAAQIAASEALTLFEALGDRQYAAYTLRTMGFIVKYRDDFETALSLHQQSLAIRQAIEDDQGILWGLAAVAEDKCNLGEMESARPIFEECLDMATRLN